MAEFFVTYPGELTDDDRRALTQPGWKLYENGIGATAAFREELPPVKWRQVVRLQAFDDEEAIQLVVDALGRRPDDIRATENRDPG